MNSYFLPFFFLIAFTFALVAFAFTGTFFDAVFFLLADFFFAGAFALATAFFFTTAFFLDDFFFAAFPNAASQPLEYCWFDPTLMTAMASISSLLN